MIEIDNTENLLLLEMNTEVEIEILNERVKLAVPTGSLQTREIIKNLYEYLDIQEENLNVFLERDDSEEGFTRYIVVKSTNAGPELAWVKVGKTDFK